MAWFSHRILLAVVQLESRFYQIAPPQREAKAQHMHESKNVIGKAGCVGVVLLDVSCRESSAITQNRP